MADCGGRGAGAGRRMAEAGRKGAQTMLMGGLNVVHVCQKSLVTFFLRNRHTTFYAYYKRDQSDSMLSVRASIRRDC
jgi:hypothetical protein